MHEVVPGGSGFDGRVKEVGISIPQGEPRESTLLAGLCLFFGKGSIKGNLGLFFFELKHHIRSKIGIGMYSIKVMSKGNGVRPITISLNPIHDGPLKNLSLVTNLNMGEPTTCFLQIEMRRL